MSKIIILGAGSIGGSVGEAFASEHEVTIIDRDAETLNRLRARMDARFLTGSADSPELLERAGCAEADIILAVTESDMVNLATSRICKTLFGESGRENRIIRIRNKELANNDELLDAFGVTISYNPENSIAISILAAVEHPGTSKVIECCEGAIKTAMVDINDDSPWLGKTISDLHAKAGELQFEVCTIRRRGRFVDNVADTRLEKNDDILFVAQAGDLLQAVRILQSKTSTTNRVFVAGGGPIGQTLATRLERNFAVTLIEPDSKRCALLAQELGSTLVLRGDPTDASLLRGEDIANAHYFCAVTETDEINIMSALLAKQLGCSNTAVLANRNAFQGVLRSYGMDMVVSPSEITSNVLLRELLQRSYVATHQLSETGENISEFTVQAGVKIEGQNFNKIQWPDNIIPCALVRHATGASAIRRRHGFWSILSGNDHDRPQLIAPNTATKVLENDAVLVYVRDSNTNVLNQLADAPFAKF